MKTKDIVTISVAVIVIAISGYFIYVLLFPKNATVKETTQAQTENLTKVPTEIDEKTFTTVSTLSDYGKPSQTGIGKADLFSDF